MDRPPTARPGPGMLGMWRALPNLLGAFLLLLVGCSPSGPPSGTDGRTAPGSAAASKETVELLNVSYDPTRELY
jgi:hypothetical protein